VQRDAGDGNICTGGALMTTKKLEQKIKQERAFRSLYAAQGNKQAVLESDNRLAELLKMLAVR